MLNRLVFAPVLRRAALLAVAIAGAAAAGGAIAAGRGWARWLLGAAVAALALAVVTLLKHGFELAVSQAALYDRAASLAAETRAHEVRLAQAEEAAATARAVHDAVLAAHDAALAAHDAAAGRNAAEVATLSRRLDGTDESVAATHQRLAELRDEAAVGRKELGAAVADARDVAVEVERQLRVGRGETHQELRRLLTRDGRRALVADWQELLGIEFDDRRLAYLERKLVDVEARCRGRVAASADDAALRALVASALPATRARVLEIGVLFAINAVYLHDVAAYFFEDFHQTLIDPFFGYYGNDEPDPYSGVLVTAEVARENLRLGGVPEDAYDIVVGLSTDAQVRAQVERHPYHAVLIDGDHSYDGVAADFAWSAGIVAPRGYVLIDDYCGPSWPDVTRFVDDVARHDDRFEFVGSFARTAVLRRRGEG